MTRLPDWPDRLQAAIDWHGDQPFLWGISDCFKFPTDVVKAMTGIDHWPDIRYKNSFQASKVLLSRSMASVGDMFASKLAEIGPSFANVGCIGTIDNYQGACGVLVLGQELVGKSKSGSLILIPRFYLKRAFKVN